MLKHDDVHVRQANGSLMGNILGTAELDIQVGQAVVQVCAIFADLPVPAILGMDFFLEARGILDFHSLELNVNGEKIKCKDQAGSSFCYRVVVETTITVPAGHEVVVPGCIKTDDEEVAIGMIEPIENGGELTNRGLVLARTLVKTGQGTVGLRILNPGVDKREVRCGMTAGIFTKVDDLDIEYVKENDLIEMQKGNCNVEVPTHLNDLLHRTVSNLSPQYHQEVVKLFSSH